MALHGPVVNNGTVKFRGMEREIVLPVAVIVSGYVPGLTGVATLIVSTDSRAAVPVSETESGRKLAVTPDTRPDTWNVTDPLNPYWGVTVSVEVPERPDSTGSEDGADVRTKDGGGVVCPSPNKIKPLCFIRAATVPFEANCKASRLKTWDARIELNVQ
jgi:hypothetical protein